MRAQTDAVAVQTEVTTPDERREYDLRGGSVVQREKFLFYRGVGTFPPPVTVKALGGDRVQVVNGAGAKVSGLVLVSVRGGKVGFQPISPLEAGATAEASIPAICGGYRAELAEHLVKELTSTGLYEKEAKAMVKTWDSAWFGEEGTRLLYLVPRAKTDELLPITIEPIPAELVRVLVGRHDFLTPEQEATADKQLQRLRGAGRSRGCASRAIDSRTFLRRSATTGREEARGRGWYGRPEVATPTTPRNNPVAEGRRSSSPLAHFQRTFSRPVWPSRGFLRKLNSVRFPNCA